MLKAISDGTLKPGVRRNYGRKTHNEVLRWLGMPEVQRPLRRICITCHQPRRKNGSGDYCRRCADAKLIGKRTGQWDVLSASNKPSLGGNKYLHCRCSCGREFDVLRTTLVNGQSTRCGPCAKIENGKKNRMDDFHVAATTIFKQYNGNAKSRGIDFNLRRGEFEKLIKQNCFYCGIRPSNMFTGFCRKNEHKHAPVMYSGIDRVDNSKGYEPGNCVPCCFQCNWSKKDLSNEQFLGWIRSVYVTKLAGIREKTLGMLVDELATTNIKCFMAQEEMLNPKKTSEQQKDAGRRAQELNARRNKLIRAIDELMGFKDQTHTAKTYGGD